MITQHAKRMKINAASLSEQDKKAIRSFKASLYQLNVPDLLAAYGNEYERQNALLFDIPLLPLLLRHAISFLVLNKPLKLSIAEKLFSEDFIAMLQRYDLAYLEDNGDALCMNGLRLIHHFGALIFCQQPDIFSYCYYGTDSLALGRLLLPARGRVLDLCAGVGTQGILCALTADQVVLVEREPKTATIFAMNAVLNDVEDKVELRLGDLLEPVQGERFDRVCCNPPLLPVPDGLPFPIVGNGGPDALIITKQIIAHLPTVLNTNGRCHIIGTLLGDENAPNLDTFQTLAQTSHVNIHLTLPCRESLAENSKMLTTLAKTVALYGEIDEKQAQQIFLEDFTKRGGSYLYSFLLTASLSSVGKEGQVTWTNHFLRNASFWTV
jgi:methylase of polypeptide subunit release factors